MEERSSVASAIPLALAQNEFSQGGPSMLELRGLRQCALMMTVAVGFGAAPASHAQPFPSNTIRIVVPVPAGTPPDIISRVVAAELGEAEGWRMLVENRPGALQTTGMLDVLKQPADGYSIYPMSVPTMLIPALLPHLGLRPNAD